MVTIFHKFLKRKPFLVSFLFSIILWILPFCYTFFSNLDINNFIVLNNPKTQNSFTWNFDNRNILFLQILENNLKVQTLNFCGLFSLGLLTISNLVFNGYMTGLIIKGLILETNDTNAILLSILPHSFELIGTFISGAVGLYGIKIGIRLFKENSPILKKMEFIEIIVLIIISYLIIAIAAYVESFFSI